MHNEDNLLPLFDSNFMSANYQICDQDEAASFYCMFIEQASPAHLQLQALVSEKDFEAIQELAHKLKTTSYIVGAKRLNHLLSQLESSLINQQFDKALELLPLTQKILAATQASINMEISRLKPYTG